MDDVARYNIARWEALAAANAPFSRPALNLDAASARALVDPERMLGEIAGRDVLCLAGGGGRQAVAFALLGARVTVADLSEAQLARDRAAAAHYGIAIAAVRADMRDLAQFPARAFNIVHHPYSLNFVPEADAVLREVARVLRPGGRYYLQCANPFSIGVGTRDWNGEGYTLRQPYVAGAPIAYEDEDWVYSGSQGARPAIPGPREYRHTLGTLVNGLAANGFVLQHVEEFKDMHPDPGAEPGSWQHLTAIAPPWLALWSIYRPDILGSAGDDHECAPRERERMCSYITEQAAIVGSAKGPTGWMHVDTATVYYDHPYHSPLDHTLNIDFVNAAEGAPTRVALELSADSARELVKKILAALEQGEIAHAGV